MNPSAGTSGAGFGGSSLNVVPSAAVNSSFIGLKESLPPKARAIIISGLPIKFRVFRWPSFLPGKFLLKVVTMVFLSSLSNSGLDHCPIQGPHAFAKTVAPISFSELIWPSLSIVPRICSEPGVTRSGTLDFIPLALACSAKLAALDMSSYDEFVQLPINATEIGSMYSWDLTSSDKSEIFLAKSGVWGPTMCGSSVVRSISIILSKYFSGFCSTSGSATSKFLFSFASFAISSLLVYLR